jgi:hypothetical protein
MAQWLTFTLAGVMALASLACQVLLDHLLGSKKPRRHGHVQEQEDVEV